MGRRFNMLRLIVDYDNGKCVPDSKALLWAHGAKDGDTLSTESMVYAVRLAVLSGDLPLDTTLYFKKEERETGIDHNGKLEFYGESPFDTYLHQAAFPHGDF
tara:strand:+ start:37590 stop:37895 length:306 start_codon:yes stop_codon:yes gene_type:complete